MPTPCITAATSECTGLIEATTFTSACTDVTLANVTLVEIMVEARKTVLMERMISLTRLKLIVVS